MKLKNLSFSYGGICALRDVSIECMPGSITGIIGPNGSGKSTLVNMMTNMLPTKDFAHVQFTTTRTFQDVRLWKGLTVLDAVLLACESRGMFRAIISTKTTNPIAHEALDHVGLMHKKDVNVTQLSYGERKLVELARALASQKPILFFDELFAGLSSVAKERVIGILIEEKKSMKTIVVIEHNLKLIQDICNSVYVLDGGRCIASGIPEEVLKNPLVQEAYSGGI